MAYFRNAPKEHEVYRHFKGSLYEIVGLAEDEKDRNNPDKIVVYRALYDDNLLWTRRLSDWLDNKGIESHPDNRTKATKRFTKITDI